MLRFSVDGQTAVGRLPEPEALSRALGRVLSDVGLAAYAVLDEQGHPRSYTAYTAFAPPYYACFFSPLNAHHVAWLNHNPRCAITLWRNPTQHGEGLEGAQIQGDFVAEPPPGERDACIKAYADRFPAVSADTIAALLARKPLPGELFCIKLARATFLFEPDFGRRNFIDVTFGFRS